MSIINKQATKENPPKKVNAFPRFKKLEIDRKYAKKIKHVQSSFEFFCEKILLICDDNDESKQAIIRLQEACIWFSRSIAKSSAIKRMARQEEKDIGFIHAPHQENDEEDDGQELFFRSLPPEPKITAPVITIKKKKINPNK